MANSYYLYQRYISYNGQDFYPAYPAEYSIDADGTQPKVIRLQNDPQCGTPDPDAIYRWFELYPNEYVCENYTKYKKLYRQVSYNNGITWATIMPYETMKGDVIEGLSTDCGFQGTQERWTWNGIDYICVDCNTKEPVEPPTVNIMFSRTQKDGTYFEVKCGESGVTLSTAITCANSSRDILSGDTNPATSITIGNCVTRIGDGAFSYWKSLSGTLRIPDSVVAISRTAFQCCSGFTGNLTIPDSVTYIGEAAFNLCTGFNGRLALSKNLKIIEEMSFTWCSGFTGNLTIPDSVTEIFNHAFNYCSGFNGTLTLSKNLTTIYYQAFHSCSGFKGTLTIPNKVTSIGVRAFYGCSGFNEIIIERTTPPTLGSGAFDNTTCPIYVPDSSVNAYKTASEWSSYSSRIKPISEKP